MLTFRAFVLLPQGVCIYGLRVDLIIVEDTLADMVEIFVIVVFVEGILPERCVFVLDGSFVAIHDVKFEIN